MSGLLSIAMIGFIAFFVVWLVKENKRTKLQSNVGQLKQHPTPLSGYGFSYVILFKIMAFVGSLFLGILIGMGSHSLIGKQDESVIPWALGLGTSIFSFYVSLFSIKLFENIATIAKNSTILINK